MSRRLRHIQATSLWLLDSVRDRDWPAVRSLALHLAHLLAGGNL